MSRAGRVSTGKGRFWNLGGVTPPSFISGRLLARSLLGSLNTQSTQKKKVTKPSLVKESLIIPEESMHFI